MDLKKTIIPNVLILIGLGIRGVIYVIEYFFYREVFFVQLKNDLFGFLIGFGILFFTSVITRGAIGFGDVKLFGIMGIFSGAICTYSTLLFSLFVSCVISIVLIIMKKKTRKDSIPFGPCIFVGYIIAMIVSSY